MNLICVAFLMVKLFLSVNCQSSDDLRQLLPPVFYIDNYEPCKEEKKTFCKVNVKLLKDPSDTGTTKFWDLIQNMKTKKTYYNHDELYHAICVNDFCPSIKLGEEKSQNSKKISECYSEKYKSLGLIANVTKMNCNNSDKGYKVRIFDSVVLFVIIVYLLYTTFATTYDNKFKYYRNSKLTPSYVVKSGILPFSLLTNWKNLKHSNHSSDFQKLKSIQGIRFYNTMLIIFCHTASSYFGGYVLNTEYFEDVYKNLIRLGIRNLFIFLVQTFFLFSGFLLSYHIFQIMDLAKFSKKIIYLSILNRYLRIIPPVLVMVSMGSSIWIVNLFYGPIKDLYSDVEFERCQNNWWTTLLFISNHYNHQNMCYFITWYLSADTQLYVLSLIILSLIWILKRQTKLIIGICIGIGVLIQVILTYTYNLDIMYKLTPENTKYDNYRCFAFSASYTSTHANMATYMVGLAFGYVYFKYGNKIIFKTFMHKLIWLVLFIGLPLSVIVITFYEYSRFTSAILSGILKPLFAIGIAIGVFGMSQKLGGVIRSICEWDFAVFMGNFTYSTYVVHYGIVFYRTAVATKPLYVSDYVLLTSFLNDVVISFFFGFLVHILVEMPALQIQNIFVPQVRKQRIAKVSK